MIHSPGVGVCHEWGVVFYLYWVEGICYFGTFCNVKAYVRLEGGSIRRSRVIKYRIPDRMDKMKPVRVYVLQSSGVSRKSGALIVRYRQKKE